MTKEDTTFGTIPDVLRDSGAGKSVLIIGAGGFVGGFLADMALRCGYRTYVGVRRSTSRRYLTDPRLHFVVLDYDSIDSMARTLAADAPEGGWTYMVWNLGVTKCVNPSDFDRINYGYLRDFIKAVKRTGLMPQKLLQMSSLSVLGLGDERGFRPFDADSHPNPNTAYGMSKLKAEIALEAQPDVPWITFRPTGIYGPHEKDYLMMIESIDRHVDVSVGFREQRLTFLYVADLVTAVFQALAAPAEAVVHKKYILTDGGDYTQKEFRELVMHLLGKSVVVSVRLPMWAVYGVSVVAERVGAMRGKPSTLNRDKFKIMKQRNWLCDITPARQDFGYSPQWPLRRGLAVTVAAYLRGKK